MVAHPQAELVNSGASAGRGRWAATGRRPIQPGTRLWDEIGLVTFSLTAGSAFLLQAMEPSIAAVTDEHSVFRTDPWGRAARSIASVMTWIYGGEEGWPKPTGCAPCTPHCTASTNMVCATPRWRPRRGRG
jgi:uncharacterized protein (DUF2236 family)